VDKALHVEEGVVSGSLEIILSSERAEISGMFSNTDKAVVGATVRIKPDPLTPFNQDRMQTAMTDQNGYFMCSGVTPGAYRVVATISSATDSTPQRSEPQTLTLAEHDKKTLNFTITPLPE